MMPNAGAAAAAAAAISNSAAMNMQTKKARSIYVGNLALGLVSETLISQFFNTALAKDPPAVADVWMSSQQTYCFVEFHTIEDASASLSLDGTVLCGRALRIGRPKDYAGDGPMGSTMGAHGMPFGMNGGLGALLSGGITAQMAMAQALAAQQVPTAPTLPPNPLLSIGAAGLAVQQAAALRSAAATPAVPAVPPTQVLVLMNMVTPNDLFDDDEFADILEDIHDECGKHGSIQGVHIPRPVAQPKPIPVGDHAAAEHPVGTLQAAVIGLGKVFVKFSTAGEAQAARGSLEGRRFSGRTVTTTFHDVGRFDRGDYS